MKDTYTSLWVKNHRVRGGKIAILRLKSCKKGLQLEVENGGSARHI